MTALLLSSVGAMSAQGEGSAESLRRQRRSHRILTLTESFAYLKLHEGILPIFNN